MLMNFLTFSFICRSKKWEGTQLGQLGFSQYIFNNFFSFCIIADSSTASNLLSAYFWINRSFNGITEREKKISWCLEIEKPWTLNTCFCELSCWANEFISFHLERFFFFVLSKNQRLLGVFYFVERYKNKQNLHLTDFPMWTWYTHHFSFYSLVKWKWNCKRQSTHLRCWKRTSE